MNCSKLARVDITSLESWNNIIFSNCDSNPLYYAHNLYLNGELVKELDIPNSVNSIGNYVFQGCSNLTCVNISNSVTSIGSYAFADCPSLNTINVLCTTPPSMGKGIFECGKNYVRDEYDIYTYANLHVPMGCKENYSAAREWRYFNKIKEDREMDGKVYYAKLAVKQGTVGYTEHDVKADEPYTIFIGAIGNNPINTVIFNGMDVSDELENGYYTTPEIKKNSILSVTYETEANEVKSLKLSSVKVYGSEGCINVKNIDEPANVIVYTSDGRVLDTQNNVVGSTCFNMVKGGVYMVKVGERTFKLAL